MSNTNKILLAVAIVLADLIFVVIPVTAIFLAYIIIVNPPWFKKFINEKL